MTARPKVSGLDCSNRFTYELRKMGFIVAEESKIEMRDQGDATTQLQNSSKYNWTNVTRFTSG
jgi:hypothetical protein